MIDTVYRIEVRWPDDAIWIPAADRGRWVALPRRPGTRPTEHLSAARSTLTQLRNQAASPSHSSRTRPEYRLVALSGEWKPVEP